MPRHASMGGIGRGRDGEVAAVEGEGEKPLKALPTASISATHMRRKHACRTTPRPPRLGMSRHATQVPHSGRVQPAQVPQRLRRRRRRAGTASRHSCSVTSWHACSEWAGAVRAGMRCLRTPARCARPMTATERRNASAATAGSGGGRAPQHRAAWCGQKRPRPHVSQSTVQSAHIGGWAHETIRQRKGSSPRNWPQRTQASARGKVSRKAW